MSSKSEKLISSWLGHFNSPCTVKNYQADLIQFINWLDKKDILAVQEKDIRNFILDLEDKELSKRTRNRRLSTIKSFYGWLQEVGHIKENPAEWIK